MSDPRTSGPGRPRRSGALGVIALLATLSFVAVVAPQGAAAVSCNGTKLGATALNQAFAGPGLGRSTGRAGYGGGDYPHAYPLPDGRVLWLFQDLFFSNDDDLRDTPDTAAHNAGLIQDGECWTILGGRGLDLIGDERTLDSRRWYWPLDGEIGADGMLWIFFAEISNPAGTGAGPGTAPSGTWLARIEPSTLEMLSFAPAPDSGTALYGWSVVSDGRFSYLYGHCNRQYVHDVDGPGQFDAECMPKAFLARVPLGRFDLRPEYWNGSGWVGDAASAVSVHTRSAANPMSVQWFGDVFVSVTKIDDWWGTKLYIDRSSTAHGPWETVRTVSVVDDRKCSSGCGNYGAFLMPWLDAGGRMTVAVSNGGEFPLWRANASLYRPSFFSFDVPGRTPSGSAAAPPAFPIVAGSAGFTPVDPVRLADSRRPGERLTRLVPDVVQTLDLRALAPLGATAVALNLTADRTDADGWVRVWPCSGPEPATSNLNPVRGSAVTNAATIPLGDGRLCLRTATQTDLLVDLNGWLTVSSIVGLVPVGSRRVVDTRSSLGSTGRLAAGGRLTVAVGADPSATAVALNVTAVDPSETGFVTVWPCDGPPPEVSNLNPQAGSTRPNLVNARLGAQGTVCLYSSGATDLLVDVVAEYRPGAPSRYAALAPQRLLDTRTDPRPYHQSNVSYLVAISAVTAALTNLTVTGPLGAGYATAFRCLSEPWPGTSNVNFAAGETTANAALVSGSRGYGCIDPSQSTDLVVDVFGIWT